jgi:hypothetical protein
MAQSRFADGAKVVIGDTNDLLAGFCGEWNEHAVECLRRRFNIERPEIIGFLKRASAIAAVVPGLAPTERRKRADNLLAAAQRVAVMDEPRQEQPNGR